MQYAPQREYVNFAVNLNTLVFSSGQYLRSNIPRCPTLLKYVDILIDPCSQTEVAYYVCLFVSSRRRSDKYILQFDVSMHYSLNS